MRQPKIVIIDYGIGNTYSVLNAIHFLGYQNAIISAEPNEILKCDALIFPGVGAFETCIRNLRDIHLDVVLNDAVIIKKKFILGICVGMQLMATKSYENGIHKGLNWISGEVKKIDLPKTFSVPHVGWNEIDYQDNKSLLFDKLAPSPNFYFDHSYYFECDKNFILAHCNYGMKITSIINYDNIYGAQFHPEKSDTNGLRFFRNFFNHIDQC